MRAMLSTNIRQNVMIDDGFILFINEILSLNISISANKQWNDILLK